VHLVPKRYLAHLLSTMNGKEAFSFNYNANIRHLLDSLSLCPCSSLYRIQDYFSLVRSPCSTASKFWLRVAFSHRTTTLVVCSPPRRPFFPSMSHLYQRSMRSRETVLHVILFITVCKQGMKSITVCKQGMTVLSETSYTEFQ